MAIASFARFALLVAASGFLYAAGSDVVFSENERHVIAAHYGGGGVGLPAGKDAPAGLHKQLRKKGTVPPELASKMQPLPDVLEAQLTPVPKGYRRVVLANFALLVTEQGNTIADVFDYTRRIGVTPWHTGMWR